MAVIAMWERIRDSGFPAPDSDPREHVEELCTMLAAADPRIRDRIALPVLDEWIGRGVFDPILAELGDRLCTMLRGESLFGRSFAVLAIGECVERDAAVDALDAARVRTWARKVTSWLRRETDSRGYVDGSGWAHAFAHGADAIGSLARCPRFGQDDLAWLMDESSSIIRRPADPAWWHGEPDRWALAMRAIMTRDLLPIEAWHRWVAALAAPPLGEDPYRDSANADAVLRALVLQLSASEEPGSDELRDRILRTLRLGSLRPFTDAEAD